LGEPVAQVRGQQEGLVAVAAQEVVGHGLFYSSATSIPNALLLTQIMSACFRLMPGPG
jgi:hypothetical protein